MPTAIPSTPESSAAPTRLHIRRQGKLRVARPLARTLELFTPLGEKQWIEGWDPAIHFPPDGAAQLGTAWTGLDATGHETFWLLVDWEPETPRVRYVRTTQGIRIGTIEVRCRPLAEGSTEVEVTYELTALSEAGDADLATWTEAWYTTFLAGWESAIQKAFAAE